MRATHCVLFGIVVVVTVYRKPMRGKVHVGLATTRHLRLPIANQYAISDSHQCSGPHRCDDQVPQFASSLPQQLIHTNFPIKDQCVKCVRE